MQLSSFGSNPVVYVDQSAALERCLQHLASSPALSFDLEFDNNRYSYGVTLCLVQVATPDTCYVIDPMVNLDLTPLYALFEQESIQKLVHSPGEDLRLLHSLGCYPKNLFDTEVVARLLNYEQTSLAALLQSKLNYPLSKKHQKSNWLRRPLSAEQIQYAADDVIWLHPLKDLLTAEAEAAGLMSFVREEQELLSQVIYQQAPKTNFLKPADQYTLSPREQYLTNELLRYRDELARNLNKPAYQVMSEELVRALANGSQPAANIQVDPSVHPCYRNGRFASSLSERIHNIRAEAEAQGLSAQKQPRERWTAAPHLKGRNMVQDRERIFDPIQQTIAKRYGTYATQLLFTSKIINELLKGTVTIRDIRPPYRQALIREVAAALGIDLGCYLG